MPKVQARWKQKSCILRCTGCSRKIVVEFVGTYKVRFPSRRELRAAGIEFDSIPSQNSTISYARAQEQDPPERDEGQERHDGA